LRSIALLNEVVFIFLNFNTLEYLLDFIFYLLIDFDIISIKINSLKAIKLLLVKQLYVYDLNINFLVFLPSLLFLFFEIFFYNDNKRDMAFDFACNYLLNL